MAVPSLPLQIAQQILEQPTQPPADPAEYERSQAQTKLPTFFENAFRALQAQEAQRQAQEAAMQHQVQQQNQLDQQQEISVADYSEIPNGPVGALHQYQFPNATVSQDQSVAIPPTSPVALSTLSPDQAPTQKAESGDDGGGNAWSRLGGRVKDLGSKLTDVAKDRITDPATAVQIVARNIRSPRDIPGEAKHEVAQRLGRTIDAAHTTLGLPFEAARELPMRLFDVESYARQVGLPIGPKPVPGTLGEATEAVRAENPYAGFGMDMATGVLAFAPLGIAAKTLQIPAIVLDAAFTGDAAVQAKPVLDAYLQGEISGKDAAKQIALVVGPQVGGVVAGHVLSKTKKAKEASSNVTELPVKPETTFPAPDADGVITLSGHENLYRGVDTTNISGDNPLATPRRGVNITPNEDVARQFSERNTTTQEAIASGDVLNVRAKPGMKLLDAQGSEYDRLMEQIVNDPAYQDTPIGSKQAWRDDFMEKAGYDGVVVDKQGLPIVRAFDAKNVGSLQAMKELKNQAISETDRPLSEMTAEQQVSLFRRQTRPTAEGQQLPSSEKIGTTNVPENVPIQPEPVVPAQLSEPLSNPIADALDLQTKPITKVKGQPVAQIAGGEQLTYDIPSMDQTMAALQRSNAVNKIVRKFPQVGNFTRLIFGGASDTSTEAAIQTAAYHVRDTGRQNLIAQYASHLRQAELRKAFSLPDVTDMSDPAQLNPRLTFTDRSGKTLSIALSDLLDTETSGVDLKVLNLTPEMRNAISLRTGMWDELVRRRQQAATRLDEIAKQGIRVPGLQQIHESVSEGTQFPRIIKGKFDENGVFSTKEYGMPANMVGRAITTDAPFLRPRAGIDLYETPDGFRIEVSSGGRVVSTKDGYQVLTHEDLAQLKKQYPDEKPPEGIRLTRVHEIPQTGEKVAVPEGSSIYELSDGTRINMTIAEARAFRKGLPKDEHPIRLETNPSTRSFTTTEMEAKGWRYEDPDTAFLQRMNEITKNTANLEFLATALKGRRDVFRTKAEIVGPGVKTGVNPIQPASKFGGAEKLNTLLREPVTEGQNITVRPFDQVRIPALKGLYGPEALVSQYEGLLDPTGRRTLLKPASDLNEVMLGAVATGDFGTLGIQMITGAIAHDMGNLTRSSVRLARGDVVGAQRSLSAVTMKALEAKVGSVMQGEDYLPNYIAKLAKEDPEFIARNANQLNPPNQSEFSSATAAGHGLARLPIVGGGFKRLNIAFQNALFVSQVEMMKSFERIYGKNMSPVLREKLGSWTRDSNGVLSSNRNGIAPLQQDIERTWGFFAARYVRSMWAIVGSLAKMDVQGNEARLALGSLVAGGTLVYTAAARAMGQKPVYDPRDSNAYSLKIAGNYVGIGGGLRALAHLVTTEADTLFTNPQALISKDFSGSNRNPILAYWRARSSPVAGLATDILTDADFRGHPIDFGSATDWGQIALSRGIPFAGQGALEANGNFFTKAGMGLVTGLGFRASPESAYQLYDDYLKNQRTIHGEQRFPDGARTTETSTNGFNTFIENDVKAAHLHDAYIGSRREGTQSQRDLQAVLDDRQKRLDAAEAQFNQTRDYVMFRKQDSAIRAASADAMKQLAIDSVGSTVDKKSLSSWFDTYKDPRAVDPITGGINSDGLEQVQEEWKTAHKGEYERIVVPNSEHGATPLETQLRKDRATITRLGWWETDKQAWAAILDRAQKAGVSLPDSVSIGAYVKARTQQLIRQAQSQGLPNPEEWANAMINRDKVVNAFNQYRSRLRLILQRDHPELTRLLARWGYNSVSAREYRMLATADRSSGEGLPVATTP